VFFHKHFGDGTPMTEFEDIQSNLLNVLRTRRGTGYFLQTFGLTKVGFRTPEEMIQILSGEIKENIRLYEPRVAVVEIEEDYDDNGTRARLIIHLRRVDNQDRFDVVIDLRNYKLDISAARRGKRPAGR
jgi:phage baseplate assembly protein W